MELDYKAIGKRIKIARIQAELSQEALAEKADLSPTHMSNIENANTKLSLPMLISIANALSVSADTLLCDSVIHSKEIFAQEIQSAVANCLADCGFHLGNYLPPKKGRQAKPALRSKVMNNSFPKPFRITKITLSTV